MDNYAYAGITSSSQISKLQMLRDTLPSAGYSRTRAVRDDYAHAAITPSSQSFQATGVPRYIAHLDFQATGVHRYIAQLKVKQGKGSQR